jgi:hypothetical protein
MNGVNKMFKKIRMYLYKIRRRDNHKSYLACCYASSNKQAEKKLHKKFRPLKYSIQKITSFKKVMPEMTFMYCYNF